MTNSSYGNFDYELCVKILNLLKVNIRSFFFSHVVFDDLGIQKCFSPWFFCWFFFFLNVIFL